MKANSPITSVKPFIIIIRLARISCAMIYKKKIILLSNELATKNHPAFDGERLINNIHAFNIL